MVEGRNQESNEHMRGCLQERHIQEEYGKTMQVLNNDSQLARQSLDVGIE
ncbi:hypothetical protein HPP92_022286 [Vanilla planifolia]|uniref:Uncharacterized protein n=1 Tax=Vanilla planifolia TaxID=51239 RepID=A0A835PPD7_VANPL|nr:hypothetical protein HPP92_022286 [Vanilla planifolia]